MKELIVVVLLQKDFNSLTNWRSIRDQFSEPNDCPIARALKRQFSGSSVSVIPSGFRLDGINYMPIYKSRQILSLDIERYAKMLQTRSKILLKFKAI